MIEGQPKPPIKVGTSTTADMQTGEVVKVRHNAMTMLRPPDGVCQDCAVDHPYDQPHNQQSLYYQMAFHATHGRYPTWTDAMAHCSPEVRETWQSRLVKLMRDKGLTVPDDLTGDIEITGR